jgi:hypothetical protein
MKARKTTEGGARKRPAAAICPVQQLAVRYAELTARFDELDRKRPEDPRDVKEQAAIEDHRAAIRDIASFIAPRSVSGAAFVAIQMGAAFEVMVNSEFDSDHERQHYERRIARYGDLLAKWFKMNGADLSPLIWRYDTTIEGPPAR